MKFEWKYVWEGMEPIGHEEAEDAAKVQAEIGIMMSHGGQVKSLKSKMKKLHSINSVLF